MGAQLSTLCETLCRALQPDDLEQLAVAAVFK
jgi:hypothetical protein